MTQCLFFRGTADTPEGAIAAALAGLAELMARYPSLIVELEQVSQTGTHWDADVRVAAIARGEGQGDGVLHRGRDDPGQRLEPKNPEHARYDNPDHPRHQGSLDDLPPSERFLTAALAGELPSIPMLDIRLSDYEISRAPEPELRRMILGLDSIRDHKSSPEPEPE